MYRSDGRVPHKHIRITQMLDEFEENDLQVFDSGNFANFGPCPEASICQTWLERRFCEDLEDPSTIGARNLLKLLDGCIYEVCRKNLPFECQYCSLISGAVTYPAKMRSIRDSPLIEDISNFAIRVLVRS